MKRIILIVAALGVGTAALAHSGATGVVKERMDMMKDLGATLKSLSVMEKEGAHDPAFIKKAGEALMLHSAHLDDMFPAGSDAAPSEAAPAIWTDRARFDALFDQMGQTGDALAASSDDPSQFSARIADIAAVCRDCHQSFRVKR